MAHPRRLPSLKSSVYVVCLFGAGCGQDGAAVTGDAANVVPDLDAGPDAGGDATLPPVDAFVAPDAGAGGVDASNVDPDGARPAVDLGLLPTPDAAPPAEDADAPVADGAVTPPDPDAAPIADAAAPLPDAGPRWTLPDRAVCPTGYAAPANAGALRDRSLLESSGIVPSPTNGDVLWLHNDSGDVARLFAVGTDGRALGRLSLRGAAARDFEDVAAAPCLDGSGPCLWVGDMGDNNRVREELGVYVVVEPLVEGPFPDARSAPPAYLPFVYPDGPHDAEALVVAPDGSAFYVFEKIDGPRARVYASVGPLVPGEVTTLAEIAEIATPGAAWPGGKMITGADLHSTGTRLLLRTYSGVWEYTLDPARRLADLSEAAPRLVVNGPASEEQGEAVAYDAAGTGLWTVSEGLRLPGAMLHHYDCLE